MKIIEISENWKQTTFEDVSVKCTNCGSKLEIEAEDVKEKYVDGILGIFFECPVCFKRNRLTGDVNIRYWNWIEYKNKKTGIKREFGYDN